MIHSDLYVWMIIAGLSLGSFAIRFSFLGLIGDRQLLNLLSARWDTPQWPFCRE